MIAKILANLTHLLLRLLGAKRRRLEAGGVSLVYYDLGPRDGEPWVLLHGLGATAGTWAPILQAFRKDCRMLAPELSSLGGTRSPHQGLTMAQAVEVVRELIDQELGGRPVTLAGISLGGWMATRFALRYPERVSRLALIASGGYRDQDWDEIQSLILVNDLAGVDRLYKALFVRVPWVMRVSRPTFLAAYTSPGVRYVLGELTEADAFQDEDLTRIRVPTSVIWAEHDGLFRLAAGRAMAAALPRAYFEVLPGCGHAAHMECPNVLVKALRRFRQATELESLPDPYTEAPWPNPTT